MDKKLRAFSQKIFQNFAKTLPTINLVREVFLLRRRVKKIEEQLKELTDGQV